MIVQADAQGLESSRMWTHNGAVYYYVTNLQGDITRILDNSGNPVVAYTYDTTWGFPIALTGAMASTLGVHNPLRYRSYIYDAETNLYYLQSRYYSPSTGKFLSADAFVSTGQGILGNNMFAYCGNNPVVNTDPQGTWTIGLSIGANITFCLGASVSIGIFFDDKGNFDMQWSYAVTGADNTNTVGGIDLGAGIALQYTDRDTVYDLYGPATYIGASGGPWWYVGADVISYSDASNLNADVNGFQITAGVGIGVDTHVVESNTKTLLSKNQLRQQSPMSQKRIQFCYKMKVV